MGSSSSGGMGVIFGRYTGVSVGEGVEVYFTGGVEAARLKFLYY
jgi:hypothetical protein